MNMIFNSSFERSGAPDITEIQKSVVVVQATISGGRYLIAGFADAHETFLDATTSLKSHKFDALLSHCKQMISLTLRPLGASKGARLSRSQ